MMRPAICVLLVLLALSLAAPPLLADEVSDAMARAKAAYSGGDLKTASTELQTALTAVNLKLIDGLTGAMPDPPSGWTAGEPEGMDASSIGVGFFTSLVVERRYFAPDKSEIKLTIAANSPMLVSLKMFIANPTMAAVAGQSGMKKVSACGYDAMEHFEEGTREIHVMAGNSTLISIVGSSNSDMKHVRTLANATDCATIAGIVE
jgi:hypothetical protein